ncbi:MAG: UDP-N-acetylmuramoyl-tripeptide--D-alanyl-D-alanine ligase [Anaerolineae bacterium]|nr:UDP-N-acetylmuramoyl-tripeptide--D-alanyl-D-alanine ligase [Anaerolineae bacterium]MDW8173030.1 UDP-N-acetylmuramoyl-tripeptide--D-alanyl-D-alanine ligase [Anaerolineae bacterium]
MLPILFMSLVALIWLLGAWLRTYRQARFYQIEEYKSGRYARWILAERERWLPLRPIAACAFGVLLGLLGDTIPEGFSAIPYVAALLAALVGVQPPPEKEIKKGFVATARARRLLAAAFSLAGLLALLGIALLATSTESDRLRASGTGLLGLTLLLGAPLWLILGNLAMTPVEALFRQRFIAQARRVLAEVQPKVIGITGSYGKTTTKNYLRDILNGRYKTYATPKSYNTMMGVCIALNNDVADDYSIEYFICEMGAYIPGEIARICNLTPPDISIVIEVGPQHLERFGSLENIAIAKYEIIKALKPQGLGVFNYDNPYVRAMYERGYPQNRIAVSTTLTLEEARAIPDGPRFLAQNVRESLLGLSFDVTDLASGEQISFTTPVVGRHNVLNILLATAVAVHEGMSLQDVAQRVRTLAPAESRLVRQVDERGVTVINDAYSANPVGVVSALEVLSLYQTGRRVVVTPGMVELGHLHDQENHKLGVLLTQHASDILLIGHKQTTPIQQGIASTTFPRERVIVFESIREALDWYKSHLSAGDTILFMNDLPDTY